MNEIENDAPQDNPGNTEPSEANGADAKAPSLDVSKETGAEKVEAPKEDNFPAKYKNADGTPNYEKLAKAYTSLEKRFGQLGNAKPNVPATSVDEYEWEAGDLQLDPEKVNEFKAQVLEKGFTKEQYKFVMDSHKAVLDSMIWTADKTEAALKAEWGKDYEAQTQAARAAFEEFAPSDVNPNDPVLNHPVVMKLLARMGAELGEDSLAGKSGSPERGMTKEDILAIQRSREYREGDPKKFAIVQAWYERNSR